MPESKFLTTEKVPQRYRGIFIGTLRNWRAMRVGTPFVKIVLYPIHQLDEWDRKNLSCAACPAISTWLIVTRAECLGSVERTPYLFVLPTSLPRHKKRGCGSS